MSDGRYKEKGYFLPPKIFLPSFNPSLDREVLYKYGGKWMVVGYILYTSGMTHDCEIREGR